MQHFGLGIVRAMVTHIKFCKYRTSNITTPSFIERNWRERRIEVSIPSTSFTCQLQPTSALVPTEVDTSNTVE